MPRYTINGVEAPVNPVTASSPAVLAALAAQIAAWDAQAAALRIAFDAEARRARQQLPASVIEAKIIQRIGPRPVLPAGASGGSGGGSNTLLYVGGAAALLAFFVLF